MKNQKRNGRRTAAGEKLKRKVVGSGVWFGAGLIGHPLPTRKQWDKVTKALGPCGDSSPETIVWVLNSYRRICGRLQECVQKHNLGMAGYHVDEIAVTAIDGLMKAHTELRERVTTYIRENDGDAPVDALKFALEETQWWDSSPNGRNLPADE